VPTRQAKKATRKPAKPRAQKPAALSARTKKADPGHGQTTVLLVPPSPAGVRVTESSALTLAAVWACVKVISESIAVMSWQVLKRRQGKGADLDPAHVVHWLLHTQSNPETPAYHFRETLAAHALTWGNGYAEIERDMAGRPVWLHQLTPDRVQPIRTGSGRLGYDIWNPRQPNTVLDMDEVYHVKGLGFDGLQGYSVIAMARSTIGAGLAMESAGDSIFANDSTPGGVLEHPGKLSDDARKNLRESWERVHGGPKNKRRVAILEEGLKWSQTSLPPEDSQWIQAQQFTVEQVCRFFRVPPHKVQHLLRATFSNIEQQSIEFVVDCLLPWAKRLESEADIKLFGQKQRGTYFTKLNVNSLLRGDAESRGKFYTLMVDRGIFSVNDVLDLEDRNPIGADGDKRMIPLNMQPLDKFGEEPPEPEKPPPPPGNEAGTEGESDDDEPTEGEPARMARLAQAFAPVLEDACRRFLRREQKEVERAVKALQGERLTAWVEEMVANQTQYAREQLAAGSRGFALALRGECPESVGAVLDLFARRSAGDGLRARASGTYPDNLDQVAAALAASLLEQLAAALEVARLVNGEAH
jgi:HK97 family phage portal protein